MKKIKKIKSGFFSRQLGVAKLAYKTGSDYFFSKKTELNEKVSETLAKRAQEITSELSLMKGSLMKAGQMLSMYGEAFLPPEANEFLKNLQSNSTYLDWNELVKEVPKKILSELKIESEPLAAASIGQVHLAKAKDSALEIPTMALKIQYPKVKEAIDSDLKALKLMLSSLKLLPRDIDTGPVFEEIRQMLYQETNYYKEMEFYEIYKEKLASDNRFVLPNIYKNFSTDKILATEFLDGHRIDSEYVQNLSQAEKNRLGDEYLDLYFRELFEWGVVQTDAHIGNYLIVPTEDGPKWGLIDFGACKVVPDPFLSNYRRLVKLCYEGKSEDYKELLTHMGYIPEDISPILYAQLWEYAQMIMIPLKIEKYDYGNSELPDELMAKMTKIFGQLRVEKIPSDGFFLDRKLGGVFITLKALKSEVQCQQILERALAFVD
jgi:predicted unusual protein kinase regulating ubiquinone biosynthesis (AarF/ABC1/UbiB family)